MIEAPRVALFADTYNEVNGAANFLRRLVSFAKEKDYPLLCVRSEGETRVSNDGSVRFLDLKRSRASFPIDGRLKYDPFLWRNRGLVKKTISEFGADVIHLTGLNDISQFGFLHAHFMDIPTLATWHTNTHEYAAERMLSLAPWLPGKLRDKIGHALERTTMFGLMRLYFLAQMQLAPNEDLVEEIGRMTKRPSFLLKRGVDVDFLSPAKRTRSQDDTEIILGFVGRLRPEKNVRVIARLDAALQVAGLSNYKFLIVGDGGERVWLEKHLKNAVFTGEICGDAVAEAFANMDLFVFPSITDAFANVVLEAMSSGVPAIAFPAGGPKFLIANSVSGFIVETEDELAAKAAEIIRFPAILAAMRKEARRFAEDHSWNAIFLKIYEYYRVCAGYEKNVRA